MRKTASAGSEAQWRATLRTLLTAPDCDAWMGHFSFAIAVIIHTVMGAEVALGYTGSGVCVSPGGSAGLQHLAIEFPEYTAVIVLAPRTSCDALIGILASDVVALVGSKVCVASKVDPSM